MVVDDFDIVGVPVLPCEAEPPLIVDPDAPCAQTISRKRLQTVAGWHSQIFESLSRVQEEQFPARRPFNRLKTSDGQVGEERLSVATLKRTNQVVVYDEYGIPSIVILAADAPSAPTLSRNGQRGPIAAEHAQLFVLNEVI